MRRYAYFAVGGIALLSAGYACKSSDSASLKGKPGTDAGNPTDGVTQAGVGTGDPSQIPGTFAYTWAHVKNGPYNALPMYKTNLKAFVVAGIDMLTNRAQQTLADHDDVLPHFQKLVHPIGICYAGEWEITHNRTNGQAQPYTGYFANGAKGLIIMRASEAMGNGQGGTFTWRAFGLAGKIFPTTNPADPTPFRSANFFTVDDLGGTRAKSFLTNPKTNEPPITPNPTVLGAAVTVARITTVFNLTSPSPGIRQLYEISELGLLGGSAVTPHHISLRAAVPPPSGNFVDFRDEMHLANFPNGLSFDIYVSDVKDVWDVIGKITLKEESLSDGCDHELHFHHPPTRTDAAAG